MADDPRTTALRYFGYFTCPDWCLMDQFDEDQHEAHRSEPRSFNTATGQSVAVSLYLSWDGTIAQVIIQTALDEHDQLDLSLSDVTVLASFLQDAEEDLNSINWVWAYEGAEADYAATGGE